MPKTLREALTELEQYAALLGDDYDALLRAYEYVEPGLASMPVEDMLAALPKEASLAPETVAQLKASLRTIDEAILEARNALARDPANRMLIEMLSGTYRQKVDLLRRTAEMTRGS